jgi:hypothetical protein
MIPRLTAAALVFTWVAVSTADETRPEIAVIEPSGSGPKDLLEPLMQVLRGAVAEAGVSQLSGEDVEWQTDEWRLAGGDERGDLEGLAQALGVDRLLVSELNEIDGALVLELKLVTPGEPVVPTVERPVERDALLPAAREAALELLGQGTPAATPTAPVAAEPPPEQVQLPAPVVPPLPEPEPRIPTAEELRQTNAAHCAARKRDLGPLKVAGAGAITPIVTLIAAWPVVYWIGMGWIYSELGMGWGGSQDKGDDRLTTEEKVLLVGGIILGVNSIVGSIMTTIVGDDICTEVPWIAMFGGALVGSAGSLGILYAYLYSDTHNGGLAFLTFFLSPVLIPAATELVAYLLFRKPKYPDSSGQPEAAASGSSFEYTPPGPAAMISHDGRGVVPGLSLGRLAF